MLMAALQTTNRLLKMLSTSDLALLEPRLERVLFRQRYYIEKANQRVDEVVFPESAVASIVAIQPDGLLVEIGLIGCEGMTGISLVLGTDRPSNAIFIQIAGEGLRMPARALSDAMSKS